MGFTEAMSWRSRLANVAGLTFGRARNLYKALGYARELFPPDYRSRYRRNAIANRLVKALPKATWNGFEIVEDEDPETETAFERAWVDLNERLNIEDVFYRADVLAGIGRYAIILMFAPGELDQPLESCTADEIQLLTPFAEEDATIAQYDIDQHSPRFGKPLYYTVKRTTIKSNDSINSSTVGKRVHYSRVIHIADGLLDDNVFGEPRLECVWNLLDDLEKVTGGGAEAYWKRADGGTQFDVDPTLDIDTEAEEAFEKKVSDFENGLRRMMLTRGMKVNRIGSDVADFKSPSEAIIAQISAGCGIPQRVLMGSEQGKLAAKQDRANWDNQAQDRQNRWATNNCIRPAVNHWIELGVLPKPAVGTYDVRFSSLTSMDDEQRAAIAVQWSTVNQNAGETVVEPDEIRERCLGLPPLKDVRGTVPTVAKGKERPYKHVHQAADRFSGSRLSYHQRVLRRRKAEYQHQQADSGAEG